MAAAGANIVLHRNVNPDIDRLSGNMLHLISVLLYVQMLFCDRFPLKLVRILMQHKKHDRLAFLIKFCTSE